MYNLIEFIGVVAREFFAPEYYIMPVLLFMGLLFFVFSFLRR